MSRALLNASATWQPIICSRSIGCESDPTDELGLNIYLWTLIRLVDVWVEKDNECGPVAHEQIVRVCNHGRVPLPKLLRLPLTSSPAYVVAATGGGGRGVRGAAQRGATGNLQGIVGDAGGGKTEDELDSGSILAPLMAKLMETGHVQQFVEQVGCCLGWVGYIFAHLVELSVAFPFKRTAVPMESQSDFPHSLVVGAPSRPVSTHRR